MDTQLARGTDQQLALEKPGALLTADDIAQIVHDLRNPLATISLESCLLEHHFDAAEERVQRGFLRVQQNCAFMSRLIEELLDLAAIDQDGLVLRRSPTEVRALLECTIDRIALHDRRIRLEAGRSVVLELDDARMERVVANLVDNALKYSPEGSEVVIRLETHGPATTISVIDSGPGIPDSELPRVFDKYSRGSAGLANAAGSGLGLYVSRRIVEAHGGRIGVHSVRGFGSRFFIELPPA